MKDLTHLGFGAPDLKLAEGNCPKGHPWATNSIPASGSGKKSRRCRTCTYAANETRRLKKRQEKLQRESYGWFLG